MFRYCTYIRSSVLDEVWGGKAFEELDQAPKPDPDPDPRLKPSMGSSCISQYHKTLKDVQKRRFESVISWQLLFSTFALEFWDKNASYILQTNIGSHWENDVVTQYILVHS
jgi:hypothetical protein